MHIDVDNVILNKSSIIERSLRRMLQEYSYNPKMDNYTHIDAMILNIERACQATIDIAQHIVASKHLGMPQNSADAFKLIEKAGLIDTEITKSMTSMTGFRNIAIHEYQELEMEILKVIVSKEYKSLIIFLESIGVKIIP